MYIDFHTHAFADAIAERAIAKLEQTVIDSGYEERAVTNGTVSDLLRRLEEWDIDKALLLPIATKPSQQTSINNWAKEVMCGRLICFGTVHPEAEDALEELERIKSLGLKGVKLHPDYQNFFADEERLYPIYSKCAELGLPVIFHAGLDAMCPDCIHCTPEMSARVLEKFPDLTVILAHMGGNECWDDVEKHLVGKNVYLDTAFVAGHLSAEQAVRIIRNHSADKILFASDCPWHSSDEERTFVQNLPLSDEEKEMIFYKNALRLLGDI